MRRPSGACADAVLHELVGRRVADVATLEVDGSLARMEQAADRLEGRRLAGAVRPDQGDDLAPADLEADPLQGVDLAVVRVDVAELEDEVARPARPMPTGPWRRRTVVRVAHVVAVPR